MPKVAKTAKNCQEVANMARNTKKVAKMAKAQIFSKPHLSDMQKLYFWPNELIKNLIKF